MALTAVLHVVSASATTVAPDQVIRHELHRMRVKLRNSASASDPLPYSERNSSSGAAEASNKVQPVPTTAQGRSTRVVHPANRMVSGWPELLAATTTVMATETNWPPPQQRYRLLRAAVLAPSDPDHQFSLKKILPAITLAARTIEQSGRVGAGPLPGWKIQIVDRNSKCSSVYGPLEAFDLYNNHAIGAIQKRSSSPNANTR